MCKVTDTAPVSPCHRKSLVVMAYPSSPPPLSPIPPTSSAAATVSTTSGEVASEAIGKRHVRFGPDVEHVFEKDFTTEEASHIWYNGEEFMAMKSEIYAMIRHVNSRPLHVNMEKEGDLDKYYWRGFEHIRQKRPRKEIRRRHVNDLLYFHKVMCVNDPIGLGRFASSNSRACMERARQLALADEWEALQIYEQDDMESDQYYGIDTTDNESTDSSSSATSYSRKESQSVRVGHHYKDAMPVVGMSICRGQDDSDSKRVGLLHDNTMPSLVPLRDGDSLSLLLIPYKMVLMLFPCVC